MFENLHVGISETLYELSSALLLPVMVAVLGLFVIVLLMLGGVLREVLERRRVRAALRQALALMTGRVPDPTGAWLALSRAPSGLPRRFTRDTTHVPASPAAIEKLLADVETDVSIQLGRLSFLARVGPMLGLLGTLIPFGPALAGLSSGDVQELSANLVTAFATTVIGLLCGAVAFALGLLRRGWYARDFDDLEFFVQLLLESHRHATGQGPEVGHDGRRPDGRLGQLV